MLHEEEKYCIHWEHFINQDYLRAYTSVRIFTYSLCVCMHVKLCTYIHTVEVHNLNELFGQVNIFYYMCYCNSLSFNVRMNDILQGYFLKKDTNLQDSTVLTHTLCHSGTTYYTCYILGTEVTQCVHLKQILPYFYTYIYIHTIIHYNSGIHTEKCHPNFQEALRNRL